MSKAMLHEGVKMKERLREGRTVLERAALAVALTCALAGGAVSAEPRAGRAPVLSETGERPREPEAPEGVLEAEPRPGRRLERVPTDRKMFDPCAGAFEIETVEASPPIEPGETIVVHGCGFGYNPPTGTVRLLGDFPGGTLEIPHSSWNSRVVVARVPPDLSGVPDVPDVKLQIIRHDGRPSPWFELGDFRAAREPRILHPSDVAVTCGLPGPDDDAECTLAQSHPLSESEFYGGATFAGRHTRVVTPREDCTATETIAGNIRIEASDTATVNLRNGWVLTGFGWGWHRLEGNGWVEEPLGVTAGASQATVTVPWALHTVDCAGPYRSVVRYRVELWAEGPRGVPYE